MTYGTNENWLKRNEEQLGNSPLSPGKPLAEDVDLLADELAAEYDNTAYRAWYCGVIYKFGIDRVRYWQQKASSGHFPSKLFGYYVRQAKSNKLAQRSDNNNVTPAPQRGLNTAYPVRGDETDDELRANIDKIFGTGY